MSISNLSSQYISASFNSLMQYSSSNIYTAAGEQITTLNVSAAYSPSGTPSGDPGFVQFASGSSFKGSIGLRFTESSRSLVVGPASTNAIGEDSLAVGSENTAVGDKSTALGDFTTAIGIGSLTAGRATVASGSYQTVVGRNNALNDDTSLFIVGTGESQQVRSTGFAVTPSGSIILPMNVSSGAPAWEGIAGEMVLGSNGLYITIDPPTWKYIPFV